MTLLLPLQEGERPVFSALSLVENAYRDFKRCGNSFESINESIILKMVTELYTISEILSLRDRKGLRHHCNDIFQLLKELPLFFNKEQVYAWEVEKKWNSQTFIPYKEMLIDYESSFNTLTPSNLYQTNNDNNSYIWQQWLIKTDLKEIKFIIEDSALRLVKWNKQRKDKSSLEKNLSRFSKYLNIDKKVSQNWIYLHMLGQQSSAIWDMYLREVPNNQFETSFYPLINIWEKALNLKKDSINSLLFDDSTLIKLGFLTNKVTEKNSWSQIWNQLMCIKIPYINTSLINTQHLLGLFLSEPKEKSIPLEWFSYIKNLPSILNVIENLEKGKVLVYGKDFSGKKSFILSLLNQLGKNAYFINHKEQVEEKQDKNRELFLADQLLQTFHNATLIINDGDKKYNLDSHKILNNPNTLQIWTISDITNVNQKFLSSFDFVFEMQTPPLNDRLILSQQIFNDKNTAFRVAQFIKEPSQIIKVGKLCHASQNFSWDYISMIIHNFQKLAKKNNQKVKLNRLDIEEGIVKLVGYPTLTENLNNLVQFYKKPEMYSAIGAKSNKGMLLVGPPGTGKTHFARNLSKIVNIPLFAPDTSVLAGNLELIDDLFSELKMHAPCILFLDEIDTLIANPKVMGVVNLEKQKIVNTFLSHIDGIENNEGIFIIGATHRKNNFDPAATRSGRLSKIIYLSTPNEQAREEIWKEHLKNKKVETNLNINELLKLSVGFSCADIMEAVNKAAILAVEENKPVIDMDCFKKICDEVFWGYSDKSMIVHEKQKQTTAYHEAGHTLLALYHGYDVPRVTIRPRENSLGATHFISEEGIFNISQEDIKKRVQIMLGGICAEKLIFSHYENGGTQDLEQSHNLIRHAICLAGLGQDGAIHLGDPQLWSNERKLSIEHEEKAFMDEQFESTESILFKNKNLLIEIAQTLLEQKEISGQVIEHFKSKIHTLNYVKNNYLTVKQEHVLHKD